MWPTQKHWDYFYGQFSTDVYSSDGRDVEIPSLCSNFLVCILAAAAGMHWELNHCVPPVCFVGLAELWDAVRLPLVPKDADSVLDWTCQQCPAVSVWQLATCVVLLCSEQSSGRQWWTVAAVFISSPFNVVRKLEPQIAAVGKWECVKEKKRWNFLPPRERKVKAEYQVPQRSSCRVGYCPLIPWFLGGSLVKQIKGLLTQTKSSNK